MTCFDFEERLQAQLDLREHRLTEGLAVHAALCGSCRELLAQFQRIETAVADWQDIEPPDDLATAVVVTLKSRVAVNIAPPVVATTGTANEIETLRPRNPSRSATLALVTSAIALCVMFGVGWHVSGNVQFAQQRASNGVTIVANPTTSSATVASPNDRQLDVLLHDAREAYAALASQALQHVSTANFLLPSTESTSPFRTNDAMNGLPDSLSRPLSPWGHELRDAFDSLLDRIFTSQDSST